MSKKIPCFLALFVLLSSLLFISCSKQDNNTLTVYAYDSFADSWGPGNKIKEEFERKYNVKVNLVPCGGAVEMYNRLCFEKEDTHADVIIGLSDTMQLDETLFESYTPSCKDDLVSYNSDRLIPFDYGYLCFVYNSDETSDIPGDLEDIIKEEYIKKYILIDPRTSSVGLSFYNWALKTMGKENADVWWQKAVENALTVCDSWSMAYGLFNEKEAPFTVSYTTSPAYHIINEGNNSIKAIEFKKGHIQTQEYLAILKGTKHREQSELFCNYILTYAQADIAVSNTMFPANLKTRIPSALSECLKPEKIL